MNLEIGDTVELEADTLAYGRDAVGRHDGVVVFLSGAAPGDRVRAQIDEVHRGFVHAHTTEVLAAGAARVTPDCPVAEKCGGCPWQHVDYESQLVAKRQSVIDALSRIGGISEPSVTEILPSPLQYGYRNRIKLRFDHGKLGFYRAETHSLVQISDCLIAEDRIRENLPAVEAFVASLATHVTRVEIISRGTLEGVVLAINSKGRLRRSDSIAARRLVEDPTNPVAGLTMWGRGWTRCWGDTSRRYLSPDHDYELELSGAGFGQVNTTANEMLVATALKKAELKPDDVVLDLYAGAGNFALPASKIARHVIAVESDTDSVEAGRKNAARCRSKNIEFVLSSVGDYLDKPAGPPPSHIILDPPRNGLGPLAAKVAAAGASRIVYVSCNPPTLARDVEVMCASGYMVKSVVPLDLFPHTFHVESVCELLLT